MSSSTLTDWADYCAKQELRRSSSRDLRIVAICA